MSLLANAIQEVFGITTTNTLLYLLVTSSG